jgi:hypothetical protein
MKIENDLITEMAGFGMNLSPAAHGINGNQFSLIPTLEYRVKLLIKRGVKFPNGVNFISKVFYYLDLHDFVWILFLSFLLVVFFLGFGFSK